jgi:hypothetical protein
MKVFDIQTAYTSAQTHSVVAESMSEAEKIFLRKYPSTEIKQIQLHSEYVLIQDTSHIRNNKEEKT